MCPVAAAFALKDKIFVPLEFLGVPILLGDPSE
jgi:hypothetical protein